MFGGDLLGEVVELGLAVYIIDAVTGKRKKVYVKDEAAKQRLLAKNKALREKLAKKKPAKKTKSGSFRKAVKKTATRKKSTKKKLWWE
jgi:hypothetical protein